MAKAMFIMDMPSSCGKCEFVFQRLDGSFRCTRNKETGKSVRLTEKPKWCPLREVPSKEHEWHDDFESGWNDCIDEILGGEENG